MTAKLSLCCNGANLAKGHYSMKFNNLTVFEKSHQNKDKRWFYRCVCDCGNTAYLPMNRLKNGGTKSCGCLIKKNAKRKHGKKGSRVYSIWSGMKSRCLSVTNKDYGKYSKYGIDDKWLDFVGFYNDMGDPPSGAHQIDRIDTTKGYTKKNCRWATVEQQHLNKLGTKIWLIDGKEYSTIKEISEAYMVSSAAVYRWFNGYSSRGKKYPPKAGFTTKKLYK